MVEPPIRVRTRLACLIALALSGCAPNGVQPPLSSDQPSTAAPVRVWIDTDPSVRPGGHEVDDGLALVQAFHSPELEIRGVSAVFGNADYSVTWPVTQDIVGRFGPPGLRAFSGADGASRLGEATDASRAIAAAVSETNLTILALGPVTNVATVVANHPELHSRIDAIVAVAGRRPGQQFRVGPQGNPLRDLNFELDPDGFQVLLDSGVPIVLAPFEISSKVWLTAAEVDRLASGGEAARWLAPSVRDWLDLWARTFEAPGFNPFDTLAVAYVTTPASITCDDLPARIDTAADDVQPGREKRYLHVAADIESATTVRYCHQAAEPFVDDLMRRLLQ